MNEQLFNIDLEKIPYLSEKESVERRKNLEIFLNNGFPNKNKEDWKFTDLNLIISRNFKSISNNNDFTFDKEINLIHDFEHNHILLVNGSLVSSNINFEEQEKVKIKSLSSLDGFKNPANNNLFYLNKALSLGGFDLEIKEDYKCKKPIIIYNYYTSNLENKIINNSNKIKLNKKSELILIEYNLNEKSKFIKNTFEKVEINEGAVLKNIMIQKAKNNGFFYKNIIGSQRYNSSYQNFILSSGIRFNKIDIEMNLDQENSNCFILSGLNLNEEEHQEIKTRINHYAPNCKSYQKIKKVLEDESNGVYQGKIFVKDNAQKTDAYQLSKALILNDLAEFNAKPELEIYADDVKCSHGSTSGSIDEDAIHYLMTRGIELSKAKKLLINGFLSEILENIPEQNLKTFLEKIIESQINGI